MTQNLDYDGYGTQGTNFANGTQNTAQYYDPGDYAYTITSTESSCNNQVLANGFSNCLDKGWVKFDEVLANWYVTNDPNFVNATSYASMDNRETCTKIAGALAGNAGQYTECNIYYYTFPQVVEHYLAGNYYNWMAATKGTAIDSGEAEGSICPANWKLPLSGGDIDTNGSFYKLVNGLIGKTITSEPYYYVYSGVINSGNLNYVGSNGFYWSAIPRGASYAYYMIIYPTTVNPSTYDYFSTGRYSGMPVRCVAR